jgi:hypothetical protein
MYSNTLGVSGRGHSNSLYSPGVSMLFGQAPSLPATSSANNGSTAAHSSNGYGHASNGHAARAQTAPVHVQAEPARTYEAPAPVQHTQVEARHAESTSAAAPAHKEPIQRKEWNIPQSKPNDSANQASANKLTLKRYHTSGIEAKMPADTTLSFGALGEAYKQNKNFRASEVNHRPLPPTELQARLVYRQHRGDAPTTHDIADALQSDIQASKAELAQAHAQQQRELGHELSAQVKAEQRRQQDDKHAAREAHQASPGFDFEFYTRHPKMIEENKKAGQFVKSQISQEERKRRAEQHEAKQLPSEVCFHQH